MDHGIVEKTMNTLNILPLAFVSQNEALTKIKGTVGALMHIQLSVEENCL
jgi:hypothetical protein